MNEWIDEWQEESTTLVILALWGGVWKKGPFEQNKLPLFPSIPSLLSLSLSLFLNLPLSFILLLSPI